MICYFWLRVKCYNGLEKASGCIEESTRKGSPNATQKAQSLSCSQQGTLQTKEPGTMSALLSTVTDNSGDKGIDYTRVQPRLPETNTREGKKEMNKWNW